MRTVSAALFAVLVVPSAQLWAQAYPSGQMRIVVPFAPGGSTDIMGRTIAQQLTERFRQQVLVENRPGASGTIGTAFVAKSPPDGHTMMIVQVSFVSNPSLFKKLPYDQSRDLTPVTNLATGPLNLTVHPSLPAKTVKQLIALAKRYPGEINYGSPGVGSISRLACALFNQMAGVEMAHIPYKGSGAAMADMLSGQVQFYAPNLFLSLPFVRAGKLHSLGVTTAQRSAIAPELPTIAEGGLPGYEVSTWFGVFVPSGTPRGTVNQLNQALAAIVKSRSMQERLAKDGLTGVASTPEEFAKEVARDTEKYGKVIRALGIPAQ
ncbi:MAG TPA: tripartite tricarboxylate transporter substrate binding protein [Burkholderiales bacterium]|nr:tripartite tricarboxylate transporter substrate binding protein [Burkholderiales bacterium]